MTTSAPRVSKTGRPRGRRAAPRVPCDDCIARATEKKEEGASIELCDSCTAALHRPRRKPEPPKLKRIRRQSNAIIDTALGVRTDPVDLPWSSNQQEQHSLQFFVKHSTPQLAGYFDSPFWQRMVLQAGQHEPAVRHAIAAIGALHERLLTGAANPDQSQDKRTQFALEQCNKSIQHLVKPPNPSAKPDLQLMLTTCVLFTCFEALQGNVQQAIIHATQGYNLLQQYATDPENRRWDVGAFAVELDQLCLLMRRLQTQDKDSTGNVSHIVKDPQAIHASHPTYFTSLQEARSALQVVLNQLTVFFLDIELDDEFYHSTISNQERHMIFTPWLASWEAAFSAFLTQNQAMLSAEDRKAAMTLKAHHLVAEIFSEVDLTLNELGWDAFHEKFSAIVNLATVVLDDGEHVDTSRIEPRWKTNGVLSSSPIATLSFSLGIVDPLYEVCSRCRDPSLRSRALDLLAKHPRQECVWSSWSAWKVGKFLMRLEESGPEIYTTQLSDTPIEQRLSQAWLEHSDSPTSRTRHRGKTTYKKTIPRATARFALNPGLFQDATPVTTTDFGTDFGADFETSSVFSSSSAWTPQTITASESSAALAAAMPEEFIAPSWIDFEGLQQFGELPLIRETPPVD